MKLILTTSPRADGDLERAGVPFLGLGYIAAYVEKFSHHQVEIFDAHTYGLNASEAAEKILEKKPDIIGVHAITDNRFKAIAFAKEIKKRNKDVIVLMGGPHFSLTAKNALELVPEIDFILKSEAEKSMVAFLDALEKKQGLDSVSGLVFSNRSGQIIDNPITEIISNLNELPMPAWHLFDLKLYNKPIDGTNIRSIGVMSARGCPNNCVYCANARSGLRLMNPQKFVDQIEFLYKEYGYKGFDFWDDTLTMVNEHAIAICNEIIKRKLDIVWYARARVNTVNKELLQLMKRAGCIRISFGVESGSPRILKIIRKNITIEQVMNAVKWSSDAGMAVLTNFMVNLPEETLDDLKQTIELMKQINKVKNCSAAYGFTVIYPGTELELMAKQKGLMPKDFSWNSPYQSPKYKVAGTDPSLFYMEWPGAELEKIKAIMTKGLGIRGNVIKKGLNKLRKIRSIGELKELIVAGIRYLGIRD
ncbi:MAG TPA: radical SAM protein [Candidatus Portnoybacteria bacterium]|nr:radical SAM protein [Candidatus Portnoybacteria bacterium]MDD5752347.1 radical SAM protein [Candidatus Portnoybacteria bacterium]HNU96857.1 radical SAM protein [Candidatus Portnoybacteria bacterium]HPH52334.1 radical SAM protein [Candidatus Portnoybacteria bacterium]HPM28543.1 radical SAM protein [Candidatus Portnoybacteria bacterium]